MVKILLSNIASEKFKKSSTEDKTFISNAIDKYLINFEKFKDTNKNIEKIGSDFYKLKVNTYISLIINFSEKLPKITDIELKNKYNGDKEVKEFKDYDSPLPSPEILKEYEKIEPGTVAKIFELVENQAQHRRDIEKNLIKQNLKLILIGQIFAFVISIIFMTIGVFMSLNYENKNIQSIILITIGGLPIITNFIFILIKKKNEYVAKKNAMKNTYREFLNMKTKILK